MPVFIMLTRLNTEAARKPKRLEQLAQAVMKQIHEDAPNIDWLGSYAVLGPCDYLDIFRADDIETATRVSTLIRTYGHAHTEVWAATEWDKFKEILRTLPGSE